MTGTSLLLRGTSCQVPGSRLFADFFVSWRELVSDPLLPK